MLLYSCQLVLLYQPQIWHRFLHHLLTQFKVTEHMKNIFGTMRRLNQRSCFGFCQVLYSNNIVNKLVITRTQSHRYSLYIDSELTIREFLNKLRELFPDHNIGLTTNANSMLEIGKTVEEEKERNELQSTKDIPLIEALLLNRLVVYEKDAKNAMQLIFGVEISEFNMTNRMNIPEHVEEGILELNTDLSNTNYTVADALAFSSIKKLQPTENKQGEVQKKLTQQQQMALNQSLLQLMKIKKFNEQTGPYLPTTNKLMTRIITLLSINWVFLFYLTYGKYGWDVGEPVSYLTGLAVDLMAMIGIFEANSALNSQRLKDKKLVESIINLKANEKMAKWRIAYLCRKLS